MESSSLRPPPIPIPPSIPRFTPDLNLSLFIFPSSFSHLRFYFLFLQYAYIPISLFIDYQALCVLRNINFFTGDSYTFNAKISFNAAFVLYTLGCISAVLIEIYRFMCAYHILRPSYQGLGQIYSAPPMISVYMHKPTRNWVKMRSWENYCFLETVSKEAWKYENNSLLQPSIRLFDNDPDMQVITGFIPAFCEMIYIHFWDSFFSTLALIPRSIINFLILIFYCKWSPFYDHPINQNITLVDFTYFDIYGNIMSLSTYASISMFVGFLIYSLMILIWLGSALSLLFFWSYFHIGRRDKFSEKYHGIGNWVKQQANARIRGLSILSFKAAPLPSASQHYKTLSRLSTSTSKSSCQMKSLENSPNRTCVVTPSSEVVIGSPSSISCMSPSLLSPGSDYYTMLPSMRSSYGSRISSLYEYDDMKMSLYEQDLKDLKPSTSLPTETFKLSQHQRTLSNHNNGDLSLVLIQPNVPTIIHHKDNVSTSSASSSVVSINSLGEGKEEMVQDNQRGFRFLSIERIATQFLNVVNKTNLPISQSTTSFHDTSNKFLSNSNSQDLFCITGNFDSSYDIDIENESLATSSTTEDEEERQAWECFPNPSFQIIENRSNSNDINIEPYSDIISMEILRQSIPPTESSQNWANAASYIFSYSQSNQQKLNQLNSQRQSRICSQLISIQEETEEESDGNGNI